MKKRTWNIAGAAHVTEEEQPDEKYYKPPRFEETAAVRPMETLDRTFKAYKATDLTKEIEKWRKCVLTGDLTIYQDVSPREQLWIFCDQLIYLVGSAHLYCLRQCPVEKKEMENFYQTFTLTYAQRELWDCFETVVNDHREYNYTDKNKVTQTYRSLMSVLIASYYLLENLEPNNAVRFVEWQPSLIT